MQPRQNIDFGACDTRGNGCLYCYANTDLRRALRAPEVIDDSSPSLYV